MHFALMLGFLAIWLLSLWLGSVTLEATGMERQTAQFQALSALTGSGFTTREAESVVNHPTRRRIVSWLMFIGNAGLILFIIAVMLYLKAALTSTSIIQIGVMLGVVIFTILFVWLGAAARLSTRMVSWFNRGGYLKPDLPGAEILHHAGGYVISRLAVGTKAPAHGCTLKDAGFWDKGLTVLAIERGDSSIPLPDAEVPILPGDYLLCYSTTAAMNSVQ